MRLARLRELPLALARFAFLAVLVAGVVFHGGTQASSQGWLERALIATAIIYIHGCVFSARVIRTEFWILAGAILLVVLGWLSACQPSSVLDFDFRVFLPLVSNAWWPHGTVDPELSMAAMQRVTSMLCALLMAIDLGCHSTWRRAALGVMAWCGVAEAVFGLAHHISGDIGNYWGTVGTIRFRDTVFGFFWYHGNAGAFLNLCWPLMAITTWREFTRPASGAGLPQLRRALSVLGLLLIFSAVWINHSRAAQAIFMLQILGAFAVFAMNGTGRMAVLQGNLRSTVVVAGFLILAIALMGSAFGIDKSLEKWYRATQGGLAVDGRWGVLKTCAQWIDEVPATGYGPGTFSAVFLVKTREMSDAPAGYWQFAHNDYLQTFVEWGWLGFILWASLGSYIIYRVFRGGFQAVRTGSDPTAVRIALVIIALLSVALHAIVDFPLQIFAIQLYAASLAGIGTAMARQAGGCTISGGSKRRKRRPHH